MHELQDLGEALTKLPKEKLRELDLPESLLDAINDYKKSLNLVHSVGKCNISAA